MMSQCKKLQREGGFTLVELLVVLIILGILTAVAIPLYTSYVRKARTAEGNTIISAIFNAEKAYYASHGQFTDLQTLVNENLLDSNDINEWGGHWEIAITGGNSLQITLTGKDETNFKGITMTFNYTPGTAPSEPTVTYNS